MKGNHRVAVPLLRTRGSTAWVVGTGVVAAAVVGTLWVTQPQNRWTAVVLVPLLLLFLLAVLGSGRWLDPEAGTLTWRRLGVRRVTVALRDVTSVDLVPGGGHVLLRVQDARRARSVPVLALTQYVHRSQPAALLSTLADTLERETPRRVVGDVAALLRAQARHVAEGGVPETSPLASHAGGQLAHAAAAGGAVGGGTSMLP